jgi:uncharacterized protein (TIGR03437 family)
VLVGLFLIALTHPSAFAASFPNDGVCATYPGRVVDEMARHQQFVRQRLRQGFLPLTSSVSAPVDVGHIAVLPDDGTLVMPANLFDLDQRGLTFTPQTGGFVVQAGTGAFDAALAAQGVLLNPPSASNPDNIGDDGARGVNLGFSFPFFGQTYTSVFIHSDGNLTFRQSDTVSTARSLARLLSGPPRIAPYFADLDPSVGGQLTVVASSSRFVVTWTDVPDFAFTGTGPRETFQVELSPDGRIRFSYNGINGREAVIGISPGAFSGEATLLDLSAASGGVSPGPIAEIFSPSTQLDLVAVTRRFYQTHDDSYEFLVVFTNFDFDLDGAFAFEVNIANDVTGIGVLSDPPVFDFARFFGSARLQSLLNMGNLRRYPVDPTTVFLRGVDSTLSILGQEAGHRFLAYADWSDPEGSAQSTALLGRDLQHWSFFFNSDASVVEGNRIRDNGNGTFTTTGAVEQYSALDQYLWGLRSPQDVGGTFLVKDPSPSSSAGRAPQLNVNFFGRRADVTLDQIIAANGPRVPNSVIAPKNFNFAFLLVVPRNTSASTEQIAQLDRIRQGWESFFSKATSARGTASTSLVRGLRWTPSPLGLLAGTQAQAQVELLAPPASDLAVTIANSNPSAVTVPPRVVIPAGSRSAAVSVTALAPGRASVSVTAPGFETSSAVIEVLSGPAASGLSLSIESGDRQTGSPGTSLRQPLQVLLRDSNRIPYVGVRVEFAVNAGDAMLSPPGTTTDGQGRASTNVTLGAAPGTITLTATVPGTSLRAQFTVFSIGQAVVPPAGIVHAASLRAGALSPGSIISIFGTNLAPLVQDAQTIPLPTRLAGALVEIGGLPAPLYYVAPGQINAQVPVELSGSTAALVVRNGASASGPVTILLRPAAPGIFTQDSSGSGPGAITHASNNLLVSSTLPAVVGEFVQIYATGLGRVNPAVSSGRAGSAQPLSPTVAQVTVTMNGVPAPVNFSGLAPGFVGVYQVNAQVPPSVRGTVVVSLSVEGISSNLATMEVR